MTAISQAPRVRVGVHLDDPTTDLTATLASLADAPVEVVLLLDEVALPASAAEKASESGELPRLSAAEAGPLASFATARSAATRSARGPAACFNALIQGADADLFVFLEAGALVTPGWLTALQAALTAGADHGLAGPSTNRGWNEQVVAASTENYKEIAEQHARWYRGQWRTLEPLYSLMPFCYAVRREVIEAVGGADPAYGTGPCWEMDLNARAARAGWRGVWALDAYVHRGPPSPTRLRREQVGLALARRIYQDRLCGRRLAGVLQPVEAHCRGDACADFAPPSLIQVRVVPTEVESPPPPSGPPPRVSCLMVTRGRAPWVAQAIRQFQAQDWPDRELIIVYDEPGDLPAQPGEASAAERESESAGLPPLSATEADPMGTLRNRSQAPVRAVQLWPPRTLGEKRDHAASLARGEVFVQWDDDDWYAPDRIRRQVTPLFAGEAELTALRDFAFLDLPTWTFRVPDSSIFSAMFVGNVAGGTLAYHRRCWDTLARYPALSLAEDAAFLAACVQRGARLLPISGRDLFVYVRHGANTWTFEADARWQTGRWRTVPEPDLGPAQAFLRSRSPRHHPPATAPAAVQVTCIMPTIAARRPFVPTAIRAFLAQDFEARELVIVEDGPGALADLVPPDPRIRYQHLGTHARSIGAKRNVACQLARGGIIVHWDDDDWMAPGWVTAQVQALRASGADVVGLDRFLAYDAARRQAWEYRWPAHQGAWVHGGTLCYTRQTWQAAPFADLFVGEDWVFQRGGHPRRIHPHTASSLYVARVHPGNTSPKDTRGGYWQPISARWVESLGPGPPEP